MSKAAFFAALKNPNNINGAGVYIVRDKDECIIYIGKAKSLKKRLTNYIAKSLDRKTSAMVEVAHNIEISLTKNEIDALILEASLVKIHQPRYNILLKDDKRLPYIFIDKKHQFPSIKSCRKNNTSNLVGAYFGPFPNSDMMNNVMNLARKTFQLRDCRDSVFSNRTRPCIQYEIGECTAPCVNFVSYSEYTKQVDNAVKFLNGDYISVINQYKKTMQLASKNMNFELAAAMRDKIILLEKFIDIPKDLKYTECDLVSFVSNTDKSIFMIGVTMIRNRIKIDTKIHTFKVPSDILNEEVIVNFLEHFYLTNKIPEKVLLNPKLVNKRKLLNYF